MKKDICIGDRVLVFDFLLFKDDISTPLSHTMRPATVIRKKLSKYNEVLLDVIFDHRPDQEFNGCFADRVKLLDGKL